MNFDVGRKVFQNVLFPNRKIVGNIALKLLATAKVMLLEMVSTEIMYLMHMIPYSNVFGSWIDKPTSFYKSADS